MNILLNQQQAFLFAALKINSNKIMKRNITFTLLLITNISFGQFSLSNTIFAKSYSKEESLYKSKSYVIDKIIGSSSDPVQFEIDPLAATSSGELTSLVYECDSKKLEGLLFAFYGDYWNDAGVVYQGYGFKNFNKEDALTMLSKIDKIINIKDALNIYEGSYGRSWDYV